MSVYDNPSAYRKALFGQRASYAAANLPATATGTLFTVTGGRVLITSLTGLVATSIQAQACAVKIVATPTTGSVNDLSGTVDVNGLAAGGLLGLTGLAADALVKSTGGGVSNVRNPVVVAAGTIGLNTAATNTGTVGWTCTWVPLDDGASLS